MPAGVVARARKPGVRLSGTGVAFARGYLRRVETLVAFARVGRASTETGVAFAGEKWVFLACFSVAEVLWVSAVVVRVSVRLCTGTDLQVCGEPVGVGHG